MFLPGTHDCVELEETLHRCKYLPYRFRPIIEVQIVLIDIPNKQVDSDGVIWLASDNKKSVDVHEISQRAQARDESAGWRGRECSE